MTLPPRSTTIVRPPHPRRCLTNGFRALLLLPLLVVYASASAADDAFPELPTTIAGCESLLTAGEYERCRDAASEAIAERKYGQSWHLLKAEAELELGQYAAAVATVEQGLKRYPWSIRLKLLAHDAFRFVGNIEAARQSITSIDRLAQATPWRYSSVHDTVALGKAALIMGADPRQVLDGFFLPARTRDADHPLPLHAIADLALSKEDFGYATELYRKLVKLDAQDAKAHFGLCCALAASDREASSTALETALRHNPRFIPALLFRAEMLIDAEQHADAEQVLDRVLAINPQHASAWAFKAVLGHLANDPEQELACRSRALATWRSNPEVDFLIGQKLSQKYRFEEGASYQASALAFDPQFVPARVQQAQDLLRLGREDDGWNLAAVAHQDDGYNITAYNLLELKDRIAKFTTIEDDDFIVRMEATEAKVYGERVLKLLHQAKDTLCPKYGLELTDKVIVEIFPDENDFAVRTFGMPSPGGYLGVCFGKVITANSPATQSQQENPQNWEAVLWHEFAHVVTLTATANRMPRWFSEGISVYEERLRNPGWGQRMNARYREMIENGDLVPIANLSGAFLDPKSPAHVDFAYFQSSLVIEFLVDSFGPEVLPRILSDLKVGMPLNTALDRHTHGLGKFDADFKRFVQQRADALAPAADWTRHDLAPFLTDDGQAIENWIADHPKNVFGLHAQANLLMEAGKYEAAKQPLETLVELHPTDTLGDNATVLLAEVNARLGNTEAERDLLDDYAARDTNAFPIYLRLISLHKKAKNWKAVRLNARRALAVNPVVPRPWIALAFAADRLNDRESALEAYRVLLTLVPEDKSEWHYRLARLLQPSAPRLARRHLLLSLEASPRHRAALDMLHTTGSRRN